MKEYLFFSIVALLCFFVIVFYNNAKDIVKKNGWKSRFSEYIKIKKNTIASFVFTVAIVVLVCFAMGFYEYSFWYMFKRFAMALFLIPVAYVDLKKQLIPNRLQLFGVGLFLVFTMVDVLVLKNPIKEVLLESGKGLLLGGGVFLFCMLISGGGMGMGDVKLFSVIGMILGWTAVFNVIFWSILCIAIFGIVMICRKKAGRKTMVPMGPFVLLGMLITIFVGN